VPSHSADRSSFRPTTTSDPTLEGVPAAAIAAADVTDRAQSVGGAYVYGYDSAGNPTLTDAGCCNSSEDRLPD
jgi:hypothetical protein